MSPKKQGPNKKSILIVDDHPILRQGLAQLLLQEPDLAVCSEAEDTPGALRAIAELKPDAAIVDISLKHGSGIELIKDIRARHPNLPVLVLSMHGESLYAERALRAGARGYVTKDEASERIIEGLRRVLSGEVYVSEKVVSEVLSKVVGDRADSQEPSVNRLSDREFEIFELLGQGLQRREISERLHLSVKTIDTYRENIKRKLKVKNRTDLLRRAIEWVQHKGTS